MLGVLLIAALFVVGIASADSSAVVHLASADKGIQSSVSFTIPAETTDNFNLVVGQNTVSGPQITAVTNVPWQITVNDPGTGYGNGAKGNPGHMVSLTTSDGKWGSSVITAPLKVGFNGGSLVAVSATSTTVYSGTAGTTTGPLNIEQDVTISDPVLPAGSIYGASIFVTLGAS